MENVISGNNKNKESTSKCTNEYIDLENKYCAPNYSPIPVVIHKAKGVWLFDVEGKKYLDMMSAYSAVSHGHCNEKLVNALTNQAKELAIVSRAFYTDKLGKFLEKLCNMTGMEMALPMNTGAEAVETAIKAARRWGYRVKGIEKNKAEIIVCTDNFHGRTTTITGFSTEELYKDDFGPFTPNFKVVRFGDENDLKNAITENTCAFLVEPMQGEAGIKIPRKGWLKEVRKICDEKNILLILDEIQTGLGRTGELFAYMHENIKPDGLILGKALGGGLLAVSAFCASSEILNLMTPGSHGSTFGGNPLSATVALEALNIIEEEGLAKKSKDMGEYLLNEIKKIKSSLILDVRGKGLWVGVEIDPSKALARDVCEKLMDIGVLSKDTHETVVRFAPPLIINKEEIDFAISAFKKVLNDF